MHSKEGKGGERGRQNAFHKQLNKIIQIKTTSSIQDSILNLKNQNEGIVLIIIWFNFLEIF